MIELVVLATLVACCAGLVFWARQAHVRASSIVEDLLDVEIPQRLAPAPALAGERRREARLRLAERRRARRGGGRRRDDLEARIRAAGVDPAAVEIPEPVHFDVPDEVDEGGVLLPQGRELED